MFRRQLLVVIVALVTSVASGDDTSNIDKGLEDALSAVLAHNNLTDIDFLENTLGIGFRVSKPVPMPYSFGRDDDLHVRVMVTRNPPSMFAGGLSYSNEFHGKDQLQLFFIPRIRPDVRRWAMDWDVKVTESVLTDAAGSVESIQWGGPTGITLEVFYSTRGDYMVSLTQRKNGAEPHSSHVTMDLIPSISLVREVGALIAAGDLRNHAQAASVLHTIFNIDPKAMRNGGWYYGNATLDSVITGVDPGDFDYRIDEFGWVSPPAFFVVPVHLNNRTVSLALSVDVYHVCVSPRDIEAELKRRALNFTLESTNPDESVYSVTGRNKITLTARRFRQCVNKLQFSQITDIGHSFSTPIVFSVEKSIDDETGDLNEGAIERVEWVIDRSKAVRLGGIDIDQLQSAQATESEQKGAIRLAGLLSKAFHDRGVGMDRLKIQTGVHPETPATTGAYVTVDAYTQ